mgnify:FL=1
MEEIINHFGSGILEIVGCACMFGIYISCVTNGGVINQFIISYMQSICG